MQTILVQHLHTFHKRTVYGIFLIFILSLCSCNSILAQKKGFPKIVIPKEFPVINTKTLEPLNQTDAGNGIKEALKRGVSVGTQSLMKPGAFYKSTIYKILLPEEIRILESKIRGNIILNAAIGKELDKTIEAMNTGAEKSIEFALPIFGNAIGNLSFADALKILSDGDGAATRYLLQTTSSQLAQTFEPEIKKALESVSIYEYWNPIVSLINKNKKILGLPDDIQPDLEAHVTQKAMEALFVEVEKQENLIRKDPLQRSTALLKKAFDYADKQP